MRELFYTSDKLKIYREGDKYEVFTVAARNLDGFIDVRSQLTCTYTNIYKRDSFGRTETWPRYNRNNDPDYSYKMALQTIERHENTPPK